MKAGRNNPCPCGSGKKYKKCCLDKDEATARMPPPRPAPKEPEGTVHLPEDPREQERGDWLECLLDAPPTRRYALWDEAVAGEGFLTADVARAGLWSLSLGATTTADAARFGAAAASLRATRPGLLVGVAPVLFDVSLGHLLREEGDGADPSAIAERLSALLSEASGYTAHWPGLLDRMMEKLAYAGQLRMLAALALAAFRDLAPSDLLAQDESIALVASSFIVLDHLAARAAGAETEADLLARLEVLPEEARPLALVYRDRVAAPWTAARELADLEAVEADLVAYLRDVEGLPYGKAALVASAVVEGVGGPDGEWEESGPPGLVFDPESLPVYVDVLLDDRDLCVAVSLIEHFPAYLRYVEAKGALPASRRRSLESALSECLPPCREAAGEEAWTPALVRALAHSPRQSPRDGTSKPEPVNPGALPAWALTPRSASRPRAPEVDWARAVAGVPSIDVLFAMHGPEPDLDAAVDAVADLLLSDAYLAWEAVVRDEQGLPLTPAHVEALDAVFDPEAEDPDARVLWIEGAPRPKVPWFESLRELASALLVALPYAASDPPPDACFDGWWRLVEALEDADLSLPPGVSSLVEVVAEGVRDRLDLQGCLRILNALGSDLGPAEARITLTDPAEAGALDELLERLAEHADAVERLGLTVGDLAGLVTLPEREQPLLYPLLAERLGLSSPEAPVAPALRLLPTPD